MLKLTSIILGAALALCVAATDSAHAACDDPVAPSVDWQGCDKRDEDLENADLSGANLERDQLQRRELGPHGPERRQSDRHEFERRGRTWARRI